MHARKFDTGDPGNKLAKLYQLLLENQWVTSLEIGLRCKTVAPSTLVAELRQQLRSTGWNVVCKDAGESKNGARIKAYSLERR